MKNQSGLPAKAMPARQSPDGSSRMAVGLRQVQAGQTLLEIVLSFSVSVMVLSAVVIGIITSLNNTQYTKNQNQANSYAQEGMAVVKKIRDSSWNDFKNLSDTTASNTKYCLGPNATKLADQDKLTLPAKNCWAQNPVPAGGIFSREIIFNHNSSECSGGSKVTVTVSWTDNKCPDPLCHRVQLVTCFSNIDLRPTL